MDLKNIHIKETTNADFNDIIEVEKQAFEKEDVAELTAGLLKDESAEPMLSLLAFENDTAVGHILFTRAYIGKVGDGPFCHILAPLAVKPDFQKQGIGGMLINEGLKRIKAMGSEIVFVLGHKEYYPKYGFIPDAKSLGFSAPFTIPEKDADAWMVQSLTPKGLEIGRGKIICADEMNKPEHWRE